MKKYALALFAAAVLVAPIAQAEDNHHKTEQHSDWSKGHRTTPAERADMSDVTDWKSENLSAPPSGYHWVKSNNQYLLIGVESGIVSSVVKAN